MTWADDVRVSFSDAGVEASLSETFEEVTADVPAAFWVAALTISRDVLHLDYFDWLSAVDEQDEGYHVVAHLYDPANHRRLLLRTAVSNEVAAVPTATAVFRGAAWHERETHEMFGIDFPGHPYLIPLLLPDGFEGHPLRKEFVLAARAAKAWPGAKDPGESDSDNAPRRRKTLPPGVPDPAIWGPRQVGYEATE
jgi:NADH-quinone oxidoreductase subunit C